MPEQHPAGAQQTDAGDDEKSMAAKPMHARCYGMRSGAAMAKWTNRARENRLPSTSTRLRSRPAATERRRICPPGSALRNHFSE
jgi:hypothetical protein